MDWGTHYTCHEFPFPKQMQIFKLHSRQSPPSAKSRSNRFWHGLPRHAQLFMRSTMPPPPLLPHSAPTLRLTCTLNHSFYKQINYVLQENSQKRAGEKNSTTEKTRIIEAKVGERWQRSDREEREGTEAGTSKRARRKSNRARVWP